jgi:hypothetical protein
MVTPPDVVRLDSAQGLLINMKQRKGQRYAESGKFEQHGYCPSRWGLAPYSFIKRNVARWREA